ncbi:hypothetical protein C8J42_102956 [Sphingomonas sp. PP-CE-1A-559]|nr:hypothetical protein C8J42_102956 [Sphingomonas sp. PP-CE-1A-559]
MRRSLQMLVLMLLLVVLVRHLAVTKSGPKPGPDSASDA